jgi:hypothetical protein
VNVTPKFSVAIPVYNKADYLRQAIASCFAQTVSDFEVMDPRITIAPRAGLAPMRIIRSRFRWRSSPTWVSSARAASIITQEPTASGFLTLTACNKECLIVNTIFA